MKKYIAFFLVFVILLSGCTTAKPQSVATDAGKFAPKNCVFNYKSEDYISLVLPYSYEYYFADIRLLRANDTVEVTELKVTGTDYPNDYEFLSFDSKIYKPENDVYGGEVLFVKNEAENVFYPFTLQKEINTAPDDTLKTYIDKHFGEGSFDSISEVRITLPSSHNEWFLAPSDLKTLFLSQIKDGGVPNNCNDTKHNHRFVHLVMSKTRFEQTLTLCTSTRTIGGIAVSGELMDAMQNSIDTKNYKKLDDAKSPQQTEAQPITVEVLKLNSSNNIIDYNQKTYSSFYTHYGYKYYFGDSVRLVPTGDTVKVDEWVTCGTGLPDDYDPFRFVGTVYTLENDTFGGEIIFVYNYSEDVYYPFRAHINIPYDEKDTVNTYIDKRYGEGSFDGITEVRFGQQYFTNEWYELPADIKDALLTELKSTSATSALCGCTHYTQTDKQRELRLVLPITRFEHTLTLCPTHSTVNGQKISKTLCDSIMSCIDMQYHKKHTK